jgi:hypothetical protein
MRKLLVVLLFACSAANAAEWVELEGVGGESFKLYVDNASIVKSYPYRKAWFKMVFSETQKAPKGIQFDESWQLMYFDCGERKLTMQQAILRKDGKQITTETNRTYLMSFEEIAPETHGEVMLDFVCKATLKSE